MSPRSNQYSVADIGFVGVGLLAGGVTAVVTRGMLPPTLVTGLAVVVIALHQRRR